MSIVVHHLTESRSDRIFWVLEELGVDYKVVVHYRTKEGRGPASLKTVSPFGKAPIVVIDDIPRTESGAIVHLLLRTYSQPGIEREPSDDSIFWSHFSEGSLMLHLQAAHTANKVAQGIAAYKVLYLLVFFMPGVSFFNWYLQKIARESIDPILLEVEQFLQNNDNFTGTRELGEGDFMMFFPLHSIAGASPPPYKIGPSTVAWVEKIKQRPAWRAAMQRMKSEEAAQRQQPGASL